MFLDNNLHIFLNKCFLNLSSNFFNDQESQCQTQKIMLFFVNRIIINHIITNILNCSLFRSSELIFNVYKYEPRNQIQFRVPGIKSRLEYENQEN